MRSKILASLSLILTFSLIHLILCLALSFGLEVLSFIKTNALSYLRKDTNKVLLISHSIPFWTTTGELRCLHGHTAMHCTVSL